MDSAQQMDVVWRIELFGGLCLRREGGVLPPFKTRRMTRLLARLACFPDRAHPRDVLAEELWPEDDPDVIRERFRQTLALLRRELEPAGVPSGSVLIADRSTVRLAARSFSTDVADFESAFRAAAASESPARQIELLRHIVALYRGELLPGFYEDWILTERGHFAERHRQALDRLTHALAAAEQWEEALEMAGQVVAADPLQEEAHCLLMRLYAQTGRSADALRQYEALERLLCTELQAEPTAAAKTLLEQIRSGVLRAPSIAPAPQTSVTAAQPAPVLSRSAVVPSPVAPTPPVPLPPAAALPVPLTRFFGREEEIRQLASLLAPLPAAETSVSCLVTLTGPGGAGKTRLALEAARCLCPEYAEAVWFVPLADVSRPELIADAILETLVSSRASPSASSHPLSRSAQSEPMEQAVTFLREYPAALLILDNFEHLQEEGTSCVQALRRRLPRLSCLITSRHKLNVEGERDLALYPLATPSSPETPDALLAYPSVQLFVDRARAARYSFALTPENATAVAMLCQSLEGLPLAIELAAAWAATLTPEQILLRLSRRFDLLISRRKDVPERHRSLQAVLEGSYQLLPPVLQHLYTRLSVFRGGWTLEAAEQIAGVPGYAAGSFHYLDGLALLQERSFVRAEERGPEMRYRLLESLREFGAEQLKAEERSELALRHADYFYALTEEAQQHLRSPNEKQWFDRLEAEYDNLRAALEWAIGNDTETALKMAALLGNFWMIRGLATEGSEWLHKALMRTGEMTAARAAALNCLALMQLSLGDYVRGALSARESLAALRALEDQSGMAKALNTLGAILMEQGEHGEAQACYEEGLTLYRAGGHRMGESIVLANLGNLAFGRGEYALACTNYEQCLTARRALGDQRGIASALDYLARAVREQGDYRRACDLHSESLAMRRELNDKQSIALSLNHLSVVKTCLGEHKEARSLLEESLIYCREIGDKLGLSEALAQMGELCRLEQDVDRARAYWSESLDLAREGGDKASMAGLLEAFACSAQSEAQHYSVAQMLGAAEAIREEISSPVRPSSRSQYAQTAATIRNTLGDERFRQAWAEGRKLTLEQAIQLPKEISRPRP